ncbi:MAG: hypothetical protein Q8L78_06095 [Coxiellaceae bacterium]|nr:hypothetical protein [Coxiellaceae bacterium]
MLSIFWEAFKKNKLLLTTEEWAVFLDVLFHCRIKKNHSTHFDYLNSCDEQFLRQCADNYVLFFEATLHLYSKKLTMTFLLSATVAFVQNNLDTLSNDLTNTLPAIKNFLLDLISLDITEEILNRLTQHLIRNYALCDNNTLKIYCEKLKVCKSMGLDLNQLLTSNGYLTDMPIFKTIVIEDDLAPSNTPQMTSMTEAVTETNALDKHITTAAQNIETAMQISINTTNDPHKKSILSASKTNFENTTIRSESVLKKFLRDFALSAAKPKISRFGEADFGNTNSMRKFFLSLSQNNQQLLKEAIPDYEITYQAGLFERNGKLIFTKKIGPAETLIKSEM